MKKALKFISSLLFHVLLIPCLIVGTVSLTWYLLPASQQTTAGLWLLSFISADKVYLFSLINIVCILAFFILGKLLNPIKNSKALNFYTHLVTWMLMLVTMGQVAYVFIVAEELSTTAFFITNVRKISISLIILIGFIYTILTPKIKVIVNRRIQAYDTAKELNMKARSSSVFIHLLKAIDFLCPEILLLLVLCFAFNIEISLYFIYFLSSIILPIIGNVVCDRRVKNEYIRKVQENKEDIADLVVDRLNGKKRKKED